MCLRKVLYPEFFLFFKKNLKKKKEKPLKLNSKKTNNSLFKMVNNVNRYQAKEDIWMANKHMKRCSTLSVIRKTQIKTTIKGIPWQSSG